MNLKQLIVKHKKKVYTSDGFHSYKTLKDRIYNIYSQAPEYMVREFYQVLEREREFYDEEIRDVVSFEKHDYLYLDLIDPRSNYPVNTINPDLCLSLLQTEAPKLDISRLYDMKGVFLLPKLDELNLTYCIYRVENNKVKVAYGCKTPERGVIEYDLDNNNLAQTDLHIANLFSNILTYVTTIDKKQITQSFQSNVNHKGSARKIHKKESVVIPVEIGKDYVTKRVNKSTSDREGVCKITHWRSGHWRKQPYGSRQNPEYKTKWIQPILVNGVI